MAFKGPVLVGFQKEGLEGGETHPNSTLVDNVAPIKDQQAGSHTEVQGFITFPWKCNK